MAKKSSEKFYLGNTLTEDDIKVINHALINFCDMGYYDDGELEEEEVDYNKECYRARELFNTFKLVSSKNSKTELSAKLSNLERNLETRNSEIYHLKKDLEKVKNLDTEKTISDLWEKIDNLENISEEYENYKYNNDKGKNPLEEELEELKNKLECANDKLDNKEKPLVNNINGNVVLPLKKYHNEYDTKKYTLFLTEEQLDNINEGLRIIGDDDIVNTNNYPTGNKTRDFINKRIKKIKRNIKTS